MKTLHAWTLRGFLDLSLREGAMTDSATVCLRLVVPGRPVTDRLTQIAALRGIAFNIVRGRLTGSGAQLDVKLRGRTLDLQRTLASYRKQGIGMTSVEPADSRIRGPIPPPSFVGALRSMAKWMSGQAWD